MLCQKTWEEAILRFLSRGFQASSKLGSFILSAKPAVLLVFDVIKKGKCLLSVELYFVHKMDFVQVEYNSGYSFSL